MALIAAAASVQTGSGPPASNGRLDLTVTGNTQSNTVAQPLGAEGVFVQAGSVPGDTHTVCLALGGLTTAAKNTLAHGSDTPVDFSVRQTQSTTVQLPGYGGTAYDHAAVVAYLSARNLAATPPLVGNALSDVAGSGFLNSPGSAPCLLS